MKINIFETNWFYGKTFIIEDEKTFVIDPSSNKKYLQYIKDNNLKIDFCYITHGHFDHFSSINELIELNPNMKIYIYKKEYESLFDPKLNISMQYKDVSKWNYKAKATSNTDMLGLLDLTNFKNNIVTIDDLTTDLEGYLVNLLFFGGHSNGSNILWFEKRNIAFVGDSFFKDVKPLLNLVTSSEQIYNESIVKLNNYELINEDTYVYPSHYDSFYLKDRKEG